MRDDEDTEPAFKTWCQSCGERSIAIESDLDSPNGRNCKRCGKPMLNGRDNSSVFERANDD